MTTVSQRYHNGITTDRRYYIGIATATLLLFFESYLDGAPPIFSPLLIFAPVSPRRARSVRCDSPFTTTTIDARTRVGLHTCVLNVTCYCSCLHSSRVRELQVQIQCLRFSHLFCVSFFYCFWALIWWNFVIDTIAIMSHWWTEVETALLINLWREDAIFSQVAATTTCSKKVYDNISEKLKSAGVERYLCRSSRR